MTPADEAADYEAGERAVEDWPPLTPDEMLRIELALASAQPQPVQAPEPEPEPKADAA